MTRVRVHLAMIGVAGVLLQAVLDAVPVTVGVVVLSALLAVVACHGAVGHLRHSRQFAGRVRLSSLFAAGSVGLWGASMVVNLVGAVRSGSAGASLATTGSLLSLLAILLAPAAVLLRCPGDGGLAIRIRRLIDAAMIFFALLLVAWQLVLQRVQTQVPANIFGVLVVITVLELLTATIAIIVLSRSMGDGVNWVNLTATSMLIFSVSTLGYLDNVGAGGAWYADGVAAAYLIATMLIGVASGGRLPSASSVEEQQASGRWALLPYAPVAVAFVLSASQQAAIGTLGPVLPWVLLGTAALVLVRQFLSMRTNQHLLSDLARQRAELSRQAFHDSLTGLGNRALFMREAQRALEQTTDARPTAVVMFDLDGFKKVNDTWGHAAGDELLRQTAERMRANLRTGDTLARLGGDEFALVLPDVADEHAAEAIAARILQDVLAPMDIGHTTMHVRSSAGVAVAHYGVVVDALLHGADVALYRAKAMGKGRVCCFDARAFGAGTEQDRLRDELNDALRRNELELH